MLPTFQVTASGQVWDRAAEFSLGGEPDPNAEPTDCSAIPAPFGALCESLGKPSVVREQVTWSTTGRDLPE